MVYYEADSVTGSCGVSVLFGFSYDKSKDYWNNDHQATIKNLKGEMELGAGLVCAAFIPNSECKEMYKRLKISGRFAYQSTPRENKNSGNQFFFVVMDNIVGEGKKTSLRKHNAKFEWPWGEDVPLVPEGN